MNAKTQMDRETRDNCARDALNIIRQDYFNDVRDIAAEVLEQAKTWHGEGQEGEELRESLDSFLSETIDGCGRVICTSQARLGLLVSDSERAYANDFGPEGMVEDGDIQWSRLMFCALRQDVLKHLDTEGFDVNDPTAHFE